MKVNTLSNPLPLAQNRASRFFITMIVLALITAVVFWLVAATPYLRMQRASFGRFPEIFWDRRYGLLLHIIGGTLALFLGPIQLWLGQTRQKLKLHRTLGKIYLLGVTLDCAAAYYLSLTTPVGFVYAAGLFGMSLACTVATVMAVVAIRYRNFAQHREWMIRSYVVILSFVFFRMIAAGLEVFGVGGSGVQGDTARATLAAWGSWAIPLLVTEFFLQWPKLRLVAVPRKESVTPVLQ
jgi:uncharacterized membrane protein